MLDDHNDELRKLKEVHEIRGVKEISISLKVDRHFPLQRVKKYLNEARQSLGTHVVFDGKDEDGSNKHIDTETAYKKITIRLEDENDVNILKIVKDRFQIGEG